MAAVGDRIDSPPVGLVCKILSVGLKHNLRKISYIVNFIITKVHIGVSIQRSRIILSTSIRSRRVSYVNWGSRS